MGKRHGFQVVCHVLCLDPSGQYLGTLSFYFLLVNIVFLLWVSKYTAFLQQVSAGHSSHGKQTVIASLYCLDVTHTLMPLEAMGINLFRADLQLNGNFLPVELKDGTGNPMLH